MDPMEKMRRVAAEVERQARLLAPEKEIGRPAKQHLVSQALLKRFCVPNGSRGKQLIRHSLAYRNASPRNTAAVGKAKDFVKYQPTLSEKWWQIVEDRLPEVFVALDSGKSFSELQEQALRCCIALHWARRQATATIDDVTYREAIEQATEPQRLAYLAQMKYGELVEDSDRLQAVRDEVFGSLEKLHESGAFFQVRIINLFTLACEALQLGALKIYRADPDSELLIGDNPVIVHSRAGTPNPMTALFDALSFTLPMGPRVMVQVYYDGSGIHTSHHSLSQETAAFWNELQISQAAAEVYYRPHSQLGTFVDRILSSQTVLHDDINQDGR